MSAFIHLSAHECIRQRGGGPGVCLRLRSHFSCPRQTLALPAVSRFLRRRLETPESSRATGGVRERPLSVSRVTAAYVTSSLRHITTG